MEVESALVAHETSRRSRGRRISTTRSKEPESRPSSHSPPASNHPMTMSRSFGTHTGKEIGAIAKPDMIRFTNALPEDSQRQDHATVASGHRLGPRLRIRTPRRWRTSRSSRNSEGWTTRSSPGFGAHSRPGTSHQQHAGHHQHEPGKPCSIDLHHRVSGKAPDVARQTSDGHSADEDRDQHARSELRCRGQVDHHDGCPDHPAQETPTTEPHGWRPRCSEGRCHSCADEHDQYTVDQNQHVDDARSPSRPETDFRSPSRSWR